MSLSRLSVKHPVTTAMLVLTVVLFGVIGLDQLPVDLLPKIEYPMLVIIARYPGAAPAEVEQLVTRRLEEAAARMAGLDLLSSSSREGMSTVQARFSWGTNLDQAAIDMREKIDMVRSYLPSDVENISVIKADPSMQPVMRVDLYGERDLGQLTNLATDVVKPAIERLEGVAAVDMVGGVERKVFIDVDPRRLQAYGVTISQVTAALRQENLSLPGGDVPIGDKRYKVRTIGELKNLEDVEEIRLLSQAGGSIPLREVATISAGPDELSSMARFDGKPSVSLLVQKRSDANTVQVARAVRQTMKDVSISLPGGAKLGASQDQSNFIEWAVQAVISSAILGGILAVVVLFAFLRDWRSTVVIGLSIPVSIVATFLAMYFSKMTLNMMSLGGMALGVGMLVDNSIVVLENIYRHHTEMGKPPLEAAVQGAEEVGMAITASTLTNLVVFLPIVFVGGLSAHLFRQLALVVTYSITSSLVVALTIVPVGCALLLSIPQSRARFRGPLGRIGDALDSWPGQYKQALAAFIKRPRAAFALIGVSVLATAGLIPLIGGEFLPPMDRREINVKVSLERGSKLEATDRVVRSVEDVVSRLPEVESYSGFVGGSRSLDAAGTVPESGSVNIRLKQGRGQGRVTQEVQDAIKQALPPFPGAEVKVERVTGVAGEQSFMGTPVEVTIKGVDYSVLRLLQKDVAARLSAVPSLKEVDSGTEDVLPEVHVEVDRRRASSYGLSAGYVATVVRASIQGETATRFRAGGTEYDAVVRLAGVYRESVPDVENLLLMSPGGQAVPLWQVAQVSRQVGPPSIQRRDQTRVVTVRASAAGRDLNAAVAAARRALAQMPLPEGYSLEFTGQAQEMFGAFSSLGFVLLIALLLDYIVLASQFESLVHPFTVMITVPLAAIGSVMGLFITGKTFSVPSLIGLITLAGVAVNNAIVFVDYANQLRKEGMDMQTALMTTGARRLRPILMTSMTTIFGLVPLAIGTGSGAELEAPLAIVVMGGLITSTFLTLFIIPVMYMWVENLMGRLRGWIAKRGETESSITKRAVPTLVVLITCASLLLSGPGDALAAAYSHAPEAAVERALASQPLFRAADARVSLLTIQAALAQARASQIPDTRPSTLPYEDTSTHIDAKTKYLLPMQASTGVAVAQRYEKALEQNIRLATLTAYYSLAKTQSLSGSAFLLEYALDKQVDIAWQARTHGLITDKDVYQTEAKASEAAAGNAAVAAAAAQARLALCKLLGYAAADSVAVQVPAYTEFAVDLDKAVQDALVNRYDVFKAQKDLEVAQYDLQLASQGAAGSPLMYVEIAQAKVTEAQAMLDYHTREVEFQVRSLHAALAATVAKYGSRQASYQALYEALRVQERRRDEGLATDADVTLARALSEQASAAVTEALCDIEIARARFAHSCSFGSALSQADTQTAQGQ